MAEVNRMNRIDAKPAATLGESIGLTLDRRGRRETDPELAMTDPQSDIDPESIVGPRRGF